MILSLPYFFGDPDGRRDCAEAVRTQRGWVAEDTGVLLGFIMLEQLFPETLEITWLAVRDDRRRGGIGSMLVNRALSTAAESGARLLCVLTLGPSVPEPGVTDGYEGTRAFYRRLGFLPIKEMSLATWKNEAALLLAKPLGLHMVNE